MKTTKQTWLILLTVATSLWLAPLATAQETDVAADAEMSAPTNHPDETAEAVSNAPTAVGTNEAPTDPEPIPQEILLSVIWPEDDHVVAQAKIKGKAQPSSRVNVNGVETEVGADGAFRASVPLKIGKNRVQVDAEDILGRTKSVDKEVVRAATPPTLEPSDQELWNP